MRSGNSRGFDFGLPSNRLVLIGAPLVAVAAAGADLVFGAGRRAAVGTGIVAGAAFLLAWAVGRELHPDRAGAAAAAAFLAPLGLLVSRPDLASTAVILLVGRVTAGTTGRTMHWVDSFVIGGIGLWAAWSDGAPGVLLVSAAMLGLVTPLYDRRRDRILGAAGVLFVIGLITTVGAEPVDPSVLLIPGLILGALALLGPQRVDSPTDREGGIITPGRVRAARFGAIAAAGAAAITAEPLALAPVWAVVVALGVRPT